MASAEGADISSSATEVASAPGGSRLFDGTKLWFSRGVPQRDWLIQNAQLNGAEIVPLEKQAHILLVDHMRKNQPPGTTSYRFVELSIRKGALEDLDDHAVGAVTRVARPVGSVTTASKGGRTPFTDAEDQFLWNLIQPLREKGAPWKGNEVYKQIEQMNPRHTFQSWRDHYIKTTQFQNRQVTDTSVLGTLPSAATRQASPVRQEPRKPTPATEQSGRAIRVVIPPKAAVGPAQATQVPHHERQISAGPSRRKRSRDEVEEAGALMPPPDPRRLAQRPTTPEEAPDGSQSLSPIMTPLSQRTPEVEERLPRRPKSPIELPKPLPHGFTDHEAKKLYKGTQQIIGYIKANPRTCNEAWRGLGKSNENRGHTAREWKSFWETVILPAYCERRGKTLSDYVALKRLGGEISEEEPGDDDEGEEERERPQGVTAEKVVEVVEPSDAGQKGIRQEPKENIVKEDEAEDEGEDQDVRGAGMEAKAQGHLAEHQHEVEPSEAPSSPGVISCSQCFTTESRKWRRDREGNLLCNECGWLLKSSGVLRPSDAQTVILDLEGDETNAEEQLLTHPLPQEQDIQKPNQQAPTPTRTDAGVQTSPIVPSATPERQRQRSPSFERDTASGTRPPAANEARKRSEGTSSKSNSQGTNKSSQNQQVESMPETSTAVDFFEEQQHRQKQVRVRSPPSPEAGASSRKKKPRLQDEPNTLAVPEISQTPEHRLQATGSFDVTNAQHSLNSPSPGYLKFQTLKSTTPHSPLFVPQDSKEKPDEEDFASPMSARQQSSPMYVHLVSEDDNARLHSDQQNPNQDDALSEADTASHYAFETAPELSEDWETAPEPTITQAQWDDVPGEAKSQTRNIVGRPGGRIETQALWNITDQVVGNADALEDAFALPEPQGGWETIEAGYEQPDSEEELHDIDGGEEVDDAVDDVEEEDDGLPEIADVVSGKYQSRTETRRIKYFVSPEPEPDAPDASIRANPSVSTSSTTSYDTDTGEYDPRQARTIEDWQQGVTRLFHPEQISHVDTDFQQICFTAIRATSVEFDRATDVVYTMMENFLQAQKRPPVNGFGQADLIREKRGVVIPSDIKGCWTEKDDNLIQSNDPENWEVMEKKHGRESCDRRFDVLEMWNRS